jgi:hypothetical protein
MLVGEQKIKKNFKALHYTLGGPYFKKYSKSSYAKYWLRLRDEMLKI